MRVNPISSNTSASKTALHSDYDRDQIRDRRPTDPHPDTLIASPAHANRHSVDSASRLARNPALPVFFANSSPISSQNFSDPALATISPRKPKALSLSLSTSTSQEQAASQPAQTRQPTRDHGTPSPSTSTTTTTATTATTRITATTHNFSTSPSAISRTHAAHSPSTATHHHVSSLEPKALSQQRIPASRSSIIRTENTVGGLPARSSRRSQSHDKSSNAVAARDADRPAIARPKRASQTMGLDQPPTPRSSASSFDGAVKTESELGGNTPLRDRRQRASFPARSYLLSREKEGRMSGSIPRLSGSLRTISDRTERDGSVSPDGTEDTKQSEDLFLNLAKDDANRRSSLGRTERRRTNTSIHLPSRLRTNDTPSPGRNDYDYGRRDSAQDDSPLIKRTSTHRSPRSPATAHPLDESSRLRYFGVNSRSSLAARSRLGRTESDLSTDMTQPYPERRGSTHDSRPYTSYLGGTRSTRAHSGADRTRAEAERARHEGTESTLSTTAPSTVWDELDDLKSRIRTLEMTGKFPPSSAAAMSTFSGERPRTATTTVTTMSSSPTHARRPSSPPHDGETPIRNQIHNLLLTALSKAKPRLSSHVYRTLEDAANDALWLSRNLNVNAAHSGMSVVNGTGGSDRQMRRKADGVCRSLTELCLALSEAQGTPSSTSTARPVSRDPHSTIRLVNGAETETAPSLSYRRSASHEPEELRRSQVSFNLNHNGHPEPRRKSMLNLSTSRAADERPDSPSTVKLQTQTRLNRSSTLRSRRLADEGYDDKLPTAASRPISRAMTEANYAGPKDRLLRNRTLNQPTAYTQGVENQPLQPQPRAAPSTQSSIPLRRNYATPTASHLAATSHSSIQPGFRRYPGGTSGVGLRGPLERDRDRTPTQADMISSSPQVETPSRATTGLARSSTMGPLRPRTNSIGTRRIGLRPRNSTITTAPGGGLDPDGID